MEQQDKRHDDKRRLHTRKCRDNGARSKEGVWVWVKKRSTHYAISWNNRPYDVLHNCNIFSFLLIDFIK